RPADAQTVPPPQRAEGKPRSEVEALRRENELLRLNLEVVLEKVRAQEAELRALRGRGAGEPPAAERVKAGGGTGGIEWLQYDRTTKEGIRLPANAAQQAESALQALREAKDNATRQRAVDALERALRNLREQLRRPGDTAPRHEPVPEKKRP